MDKLRPYLPGMLVLTYVSTMLVLKLTAAGAFVALAWHACSGA